LERRTPPGTAIPSGEPYVNKSIALYGEKVKKIAALQPLFTLDKFIIPTTNRGISNAVQT